MTRLSAWGLWAWLGVVAALSCTGPSSPRSAVQQSSISSSRPPEAPHPEDGRASAIAQVSTCEVEAQSIEQEFWQVRVAMDQAGALRMAFNHAQDLLPRCQRSEPVWYAIVRTLELGLVSLPVQLAEQEVRTALEAARSGASKCPSSIRIRTVLARLEGTDLAARDALALDGSYAPASLALAVALASSGKGEEALSILDMKEVQKLPGAYTARSTTLLSLGNVKQAIASARREVDSAGTESPEPTVRKFIVRDAELALGVALHAARRTVEAKPHLEIAAALGSQAARELLASQPAGRSN